MRGQWHVEGSDDGIIWAHLISFHGSDLAHATFDLEMELARYSWVRLISPSGQVEEKAYTKSKDKA